MSEYPKVTRVYPDSSSKGSFLARGMRSKDEGFSAAQVVFESGVYYALIDESLIEIPQAALGILGQSADNDRD